MRKGKGGKGSAVKFEPTISARASTDPSSHAAWASSDHEANHNIASNRGWEMGREKVGIGEARADRSYLSLSSSRVFFFWRWWSDVSGRWAKFPFFSHPTLQGFWWFSLSSFIGAEPVINQPHRSVSHPPKRGKRWSGSDTLPVQSHIPWQAHELAQEFFSFLSLLPANKSLVRAPAILRQSPPLRVESRPP